jgi:hypothetical protein
VQYAYDFGNPLFPTIENRHGQRFLQAEPDCYPTGSRFFCNFQTNLSATATGANATTDQSYTVIKTQVDCEFDSSVVVDFKNAKGCTCTTNIFKNGATEPSSSCLCQLCPAGFGNNPVNIDCDYEGQTNDPVILGTCTSFDCNFACNGTCAYGCDNPPPECAEMCTGTGSPTPAPTGAGHASGGGRSSSMAFGLFFVASGLASMCMW